MIQRISARIESRRLPDGKGGLFIDDELMETFESEASSDSAAILMVRMMVVAGVAEQAGQVYKDEKPIDLFDMRVR